MRPSFTIKFLIAALLAAVQTALALDITSADDFPVNESVSKISITTEILVGPENLPDGSVLIDTQKTGVTIGGTSANKGGSLIIDGQGQSMSIMELSHDYSTTSKFYYMKEFTLTNLGNSEPDYDDLEDSGTNFGIFGKRNTRTTTGVSRSFQWSNVETVNITNNVRTISDSQNKDVAGVLSAGQGLQFGYGKDLIIDNNKTISTQGTVKGGAVHTALTYTTSSGSRSGGSLQIRSMKTEGGLISLSGNAVELVGDKAAVTGYGGAVYAEGGIDFGSTSSMNIKVDTNICNNTITRVCEEGQDASGMVLAGGAFHAASIRFVYNLDNTVSISGNGIDASNADGGTLKGGAFCIEKAESDIQGSYGLTISNNSGNIDFTGNYIKGNESADIKGGAIYFGSTQAGPLKISNNTGDVVFRGNYESDGETTVLHSLYADLSNASNTFEWSAAEGHSIEVHDSITLTKTGSQKVLTFNKNGSTYSAGVVNVSGSVQCNKISYIDIIGNKFIDNQGNNVRTVLGGTIHSDAAFHMLYTAGDIVVKDNTVLFGDSEGCHTSVRGGVVYTKGQFSIQASTGYVKFLNNIVTKTGTSGGCEYLGAVAEVRSFTLNANSGPMIIFQNNGFDLGDTGGLVRGGVISMEWIAPIMFGGYSISVPTSLAITNNSSDIGFTGNFIKAGTGTSMGGALYGEGFDYNGTIYDAPVKITGNKKVVSFAENYVSGKNVSGGAIAACEHAPLIQSNKYVDFSENVIQATADGGELKGGAIYLALVQIFWHQGAGMTDIKSEQVMKRKRK